MFPAPFGNISNIFAAAAAAAANPPNAASNQAAGTAASTERSAPASDHLGVATAPTSSSMDSASISIAPLYKELEEIPISEKAAYIYALQTNPELLGESDLAKFVLAENLNFKVISSALKNSCD